MPRRSRQLSTAEWDRLRELEPFASSGLPDPAHTIALVIEEDGRLIAATILVEEVLWHFAVAPEAQRNPTIFRQLIADGLDTLQQYGVPNVHTTIPDRLPDVAAMAERLGFIPADGTLYLLAVPPKPE